jgi:hypothetical protein
MGESGITDAAGIGIICNPCGPGSDVSLNHVHDLRHRVVDSVNLTVSMTRLLT